MKTLSDRLLYIHILGIIIVAPLLYYILVPYEHSIEFIESLQLIMLFIGGAISVILSHIQDEQKYFWLWAGIWWILLFGRSINWGRLYFSDDVPKIIFKCIGGGLIALVLLYPMLPKVRQNIVAVLKLKGIPFKILLSLGFMFFLVDQIDQSRFLYQLLADHIMIRSQNLLEEVVELFFILGLFEFIRFYARRDVIKND